MKEETLKGFLVTVGSLFLLLFCLSPWIFMIITSFSHKADYLAPETRFHFTWQNYLDVVTNHSLHFMDHFRNSLIVSGISAVAAVVIAALAAYVMSRQDMPAKGPLLFFVLTASLFPPISLVSYLFKLMSGIGWINTLKALILPYIAWILPLALWVLTGYFAQIPRELDQAAWIDGCSYPQTLWHVILPVAMPAILSVGLLSFIFAFNEFLFALILTTNHEARTVPVGIALFQGLHGQIPWGSIMAASSITTLPMALLTIIFQNRIVQGLTRGAVKG